MKSRQYSRFWLASPAQFATAPHRWLAGFFFLAAFPLSSTAQSATAEPCALVSSASVAWASSNPSATAGAKYTVDAELAHACLESVPLIAEDTAKILDGLEAYWVFSSTTAWLKDPPASYPVPGVDLYGGLDAIRKGINNGTITGEYQFQVALQSLIYKGADGHLDYWTDLLDVFSFGHQSIGPVAAVSEDGISLPLSYYTFHDLQNVPADQRSSITSINGQLAADYFDSLTAYALFPDKDAQLAYVFADVARIAAAQFQGVFSDGRPGSYFGNSTKLTFANGTEHIYSGTATSTRDFSNVTDGVSFYKEFCSPKPERSSTEGSPRSLSGYPPSHFRDREGTIAGYFLEGDHSDTAVLSIHDFAEGSAQAEDAQRTLSAFLQACREQSKTRLIIDESSNTGGNSLMPFDYFKQLFPSIEPYNVQTARASNEFDLLGTTVSELASSAAAAEITGHLSGNSTSIEGIANRVRYSPFDAESFTYPNESAITWSELFGPQYYHDDNFTNLFGRQFFNPSYTEKAGAITVSGYGNRSSLLPQAFESENIILLSNGACDSACALFAFFLKYQGKVKQIALGGRPQEGPMQAVGGTRGTQGEPLKELLHISEKGLQLASPVQAAQLNQTAIGTIGGGKGRYVLERAVSFDSAQLNLYNHIAPGDVSLTPLHFTYEAADCRLFYTPQTAVNITASWNRVADVFKGGLTDCVGGSTGQPTSLSGNAELYNNGLPANVSRSDIPGNIPLQAQTEDPANRTNGASVVSLSYGLTLVAAGVGVVFLSIV